MAISGMYFQSMLNEKIYVQYGTSSATTLYDLSENSLDRSLVQAFHGLHVFSVCDTTSCFYGRGTLKKHNIFLEYMVCPLFQVLPSKTCTYCQNSCPKQRGEYSDYFSMCFINCFVNILYRDVANFASA